MTLSQARQRLESSAVIDIRTTADILGVSTKTIYDWVHANKIAHVKMDRKHLILSAPLLAMLQLGECEAA